MCLALIRSRTSGSSATRGPSAAALGWKLAHGEMRGEDLSALRAAVRAELARAPYPQRWLLREPMRTLLAEYRKLRGVPARARGRSCTRAGRRTGGRR